MLTSANLILKFDDLLNRHSEHAFQQLALVLGDQLNARHSWWQEVIPNRLVVMVEAAEEASYVRHHRQKVLAFFAAMRNFAQALADKGHTVLYLTLDNPQNPGSITTTLSALVEQLEPHLVTLQEPDEYRLQQALETWQNEHSAVAMKWCSSEHFMTERTVLVDWFGERKSYLMESFYRRMRQQTGYLMDAANKPLGGKWNFDKANRNALPQDASIPAPLLFANDVTELDQMLNERGIETLGEVNPKQLLWPTTRRQSRELLNHFLTTCLPNFGLYQDALTDRGWSLFHSRISFALNSKMLSPAEVVERAIDYWQAHQDEIDLAQIEGFVRQIIGWREFIRAIYWQQMPAYAELNFFDHNRPLPEFYWTGKTHMKCLRESIEQSLEYAYAHHIQRLMVTGNFALLSGINPDALDAWYLGIYIDAIEWVEMPNTRGMSQYADGGLLATKPYVSSGNYIDKMSDYCGSCHYDVKQKTGAKACPFNSLYWHFIDRHRDKLAGNHRMSLILKQWEKRDPSQRKALLNQAEQYLEQINTL